MRNIIIGLLAETSLHPGTEQSAGVIDLPVARESHTGYPVVVGSSLKGAIRDMVRQKVKVLGKEIFGASDNSGIVAVTDARLLLLPVRSLTGHFKWVTCPYLLERFQRDMELVGLHQPFSIPHVEKGRAIPMKSIDSKQGNLFLEELSFMVEACEAEISGIVKVITPLIHYQSVKERLKKQLVIVSDDDFEYFASYGLQINARNVLHEETKTSKNLWYEETIPADSVFYAILMARPGKEDALDKVKGFFRGRPYLQVGGNESIGQGWCAIAWLEEGEGNE